MEKVIFMRDLKLGRAETTWICWGALEGQRTWGPFLYPTLRTSLRFICLLCLLCLLTLHHERQDQRVQSALSGGVTGGEEDEQF